MMSGGDGDIESEAKRLRIPVAMLAETDRHRPVEIWPDQVAVVNLFSASLTQWRMGPAGPIGLDYSAVESIMRMRKVPARDRSAMLDDIRIMERAALAAMREGR